MSYGLLEDKSINEGRNLTMERDLKGIDHLLDIRISKCVLLSCSLGRDCFINQVILRYVLNQLVEQPIESMGQTGPFTPQVNKSKDRSVTVNTQMAEMTVAVFRMLALSRIALELMWPSV